MSNKINDLKRIIRVISLLENSLNLDYIKRGLDGKIKRYSKFNDRRNKIIIKNAVSLLKNTRIYKRYKNKKVKSNER